MRALLLALVFTPAAAAASDDAELLARITQRQLELSSYRVDMRISVFDGASETPALEIPARSTRSGTALMQEFQSYLVLIRPEMRVLVDRDGRTIYLNAAQAETPAAPFSDPARALQQARDAGYEVQVDEAGDGPRLRFTAPGRPDCLLEFGADLKLRRMQMDAPQGVAESARTSVTYSWSEAPADDARLSTDYYVRRVRGEWQPGEALAGYRIVVSREP